jgi:flagellar basal-body rod protein FlgB
MELISSLTTDVMHKALNGLAKRHDAISGNLANVDTPSYKRRDVSFEGALSNAIQNQKNKGNRSLHPVSNDEPMSLRTTNSAHFSIGNNNALTVNDVNADIEEQDSLEYRKDGNSVDVETEMVQLARNTQRYQALTTMESRSFKSLRNIINGGGG